MELNILPSLILLWRLGLIDTATLFHFLNGEIILEMSEQTAGLLVHFVVHQVNEGRGPLGVLQVDVVYYSAVDNDVILG